VGANGIAYYHGDLFVTNTNKRTIVRIPVAEDGSAGQPAVWKTLEDVPESPLFALPCQSCRRPRLDVHGNLYLTILTGTPSSVSKLRTRSRRASRSSFAPVGPVGPIRHTGEPGVWDGAGEQQNLFVTNLGMMAAIIPGRSGPAGPC